MRKSVMWLVLLGCVFLSGMVRAAGIGDVFKGRLEKWPDRPSLGEASVDRPVPAAISFDGDRCTAVAELVPLVGVSSTNVSGRLVQIRCKSGKTPGRGFAAGGVDPKAPLETELMIGVID